MKKPKLTKQQNKLICKAVTKILSESGLQEAAINARRLLVKEFRKVNQQTDRSALATLNNAL